VEEGIHNRGSMKTLTMTAGREAVGKWPLPSSSTHASTGALGGPSLVIYRAETRATFAVGELAPEGMMLLGAT
jgi:hypothetical protein